jgi:glycosyltransferase involved in cell wall biosynthesis
MAAWTILTCDYPPISGGVGDYTAQVAAALVAIGDQVTVAYPSARARSLVNPADEPKHIEQAGVRVIELEDVYGSRSRQLLDDRIDPSSTILVQYVPTAFGLFGANLPFCRWLQRRSRRHRDVRVMFHEPYFEYAWRPIYQTPLSIVQRWMAKVLLDTALHAYLSTDSWRRYLEPYAGADRRRFVTLPIPSPIPRWDRPAEAVQKRETLVGSSPKAKLVGHFGTFGTHISPALGDVLLRLLAEEPDTFVVCLGNGSEEFVKSLASSAPALDGRVRGLGRVMPFQAANVIASCDLMVQPYVDGVTTRRTSAMAGLINARPLLTTTGHLTEPLWAETKAVEMIPAGDIQGLVSAARRLLADDEARAALGARADQTYRERFAIGHTIRRLRGAAEGA